MSNAVIIFFTLITAAAVYFALRRSFAFLLPVLASAVIAYRTEFVFFDFKYIAVVFGLGLLFALAARFFPAAKKALAVIAVLAVYALMLARIC